MNDVPLIKLFSESVRIPAVKMFHPLHGFCVVHVVSGGAHQPTQNRTVGTCKHAGCQEHVLIFCVTGYCPNHCVSRRCTCHPHVLPTEGAGQQRLAPSARPRICRHVGCTTTVLPSCRTGFCATHCTSARCSCRHESTPIPPPPVCFERRSAAPRVSQHAMPAVCRAEGGSFWSPQKTVILGTHPNGQVARTTQTCGQPGHVARTPGHLAPRPGTWPGW